MPAMKFVFSFLAKNPFRHPIKRLMRHAKIFISPTKHPSKRKRKKEITLNSSSVSTASIDHVSATARVIFPHQPQGKHHQYLSVFLKLFAEVVACSKTIWDELICYTVISLISRVLMICFAVIIIEIQ
uniref:Uncharacterized protein n=1 Tax=Oryza brachyantha TaxID=4533 RepID=J3LAA3_ORYBR